MALQLQRPGQVFAGQLPLNPEPPDNLPGLLA